MIRVISIPEIIRILSTSPFYLRMDDREKGELAYLNWLSAAKSVEDSKNKTEESNGKG